MSWSAGPAACATAGFTRGEGPGGDSETRAEDRLTEQGEQDVISWREVHHEYPQMLNEFVARACALCSAEERRRITGFHLCQGDVAQELSHLMAHERVNLLVVGWHGHFMTGHAQVLKMLICRLAVRCSS